VRQRRCKISRILRDRNECGGHLAVLRMLPMRPFQQGCGLAMRPVRVQRDGIDIGLPRVIRRELLGAPQQIQRAAVLAPAPPLPSKSAPSFLPRRCRRYRYAAAPGRASEPPPAPGTALPVRVLFAAERGGAAVRPSKRLGAAAGGVMTIGIMSALPRPGPAAAAALVNRGMGQDRWSIPPAARPSAGVPPLSPAGRQTQSRLGLRRPMSGSDLADWRHAHSRR
jgi:hypothetical protein